MRFDLSAARSFLDYLDGKSDLEQVLMHPAYRTVFSHARLFGTGLQADDVRQAVRGEQTSFYGLKNLEGSRPRMEMLLTRIAAEASDWQKEVTSEITRLVPDADLSQLTVYPIVGYDAGIGHDNCICMNINWQPFQDAPLEFLYLAIHEAFHAVYEHLHRLPLFQQVTTQEARYAYFCSMLQNEGLAVYAPLHLRNINGDESYRHHPVIGDDYVVLKSEQSLLLSVRLFRELLELLRKEEMSLDQYAELVFGPERITYRVGCRLATLIEERLGLLELRKAVCLSGQEMVAQYADLLT